MDAVMRGEKEKRGWYCLSKVSILRDLCSILVIMASALSASTNPPESAIFNFLLFLFLAPNQTQPRVEVPYLVSWVLCYSSKTMLAY